MTRLRTKHERVFGFDLDGVIVDFVTSYNRVFVKHFPKHAYAIVSVPLVYDWFLSYPWEDIMDEKGIRNQTIREFSFGWMNSREVSDDIFENAEIYPGAKEAIERIVILCKDKGIQLRIITYRTVSAQPATFRWLAKQELPIRQVFLVDTYQDKWRAAPVIVDDSYKVLNIKPDDCVSIKYNTPYNTDTVANYNVNTLFDVIPLIDKIF